MLEYVLIDYGHDQIFYMDSLLYLFIIWTPWTKVAPLSMAAPACTASIISSLVIPLCKPSLV